MQQGDYVVEFAQHKDARQFERGLRVTGKTKLRRVQRHGFVVVAVNNAGKAAIQVGQHDGDAMRQRKPHGGHGDGGVAEGQQCIHAAGVKHANFMGTAHDDEAFTILPGERALFNQIQAA